MSRSSRSRPSSSLLLVLLLAPPPLAGAVRLEATAHAERQGSALAIHLELRNRGDTEARPLVLSAALLGETETTRLEGGIPSGGLREATLPFRETTSGRHALVLRFSYPLAPGGTDLVESLALVGVTVDRETAPEVELLAGDLALETAGAWHLHLASVDGRAHEAVLSIEVPKGLGVSPSEERVTIPAGGKDVTVTLFRGQSPRGGGLSVWAVVEPDLGSAVFREARVRISEDPALLPRLRVGLLILAVALLLGAFGIELRARFFSPPGDPSAGP